MSNLLMTPLRTNLVNFKLCAEHAPEGTYIEAKKLNELLSSATKSLVAELELCGLNPGTDELKQHAEAALYDYVKKANAQMNIFALAEEFGRTVSGPDGGQVVEQTATDRDAVKRLLERLG